MHIKFKITSASFLSVLEFELRKAKETIKALRTNLTVATGWLCAILFFE